MATFTRATRIAHRVTAFEKFGESITYRQRSDTIALTTGVVTESNTDTTITNVLLGHITERTIRDSGGKYLVGDRVFKIQDDSIPEEPPVVTSEIIADGDTYKIVGWDEATDQGVWQIIGRRV